MERFGPQAVYGRSLGLVEMRRIMHAERVVNVYRDMIRGDMAKWQAAHPQDFAFISTVIKIYEQGKPKVTKRAHRKH